MHMPVLMLNAERLICCTSTHIRKRLSGWWSATAAADLLHLSAFQRWHMTSAGLQICFNGLFVLHWFRGERAKDKLVTFTGLHFHLFHYTVSLVFVHLQPGQSEAKIGYIFWLIDFVSQITKKDFRLDFREILWWGNRDQCHLMGLATHVWFFRVTWYM